MVSFQDDVVDQSGGADAHRGGEDARLEVGLLDVVDVEPVEQAAIVRRQGAGEGQRALALLGREVGVARGEGEPVGVAHRRHDADLDRHGQVAHHPPDDRHLLGVLLAEVGAARADEVEQLQADGCDAAEVAGPVLALEQRAEPLDVDPGLEARRVDLLGRGDEEHVHARLFGELGIAILVARVALEVLALAELGRVDEQARDDGLVLAPRRLEQGEVPLVEGSHRGHEPDLPFEPELCRAAGNPHRAVASASTS